MCVVVPDIVPSTMLYESRSIALKSLLSCRLRATL